MYLFQKVCKNLLKNKGRNFILLVLLSIVSTTSVVALTIWNVSGQIYRETENYYAGEVSLTAAGNTSTSNSLTTEDYKKFADSDYLRSHVINRQAAINVTGINLLGGIRDTAGKGVVVNAWIYGLLDARSSDDFSYGERTIIKGNFPANKNECIISNDLADLNKLSVGDAIDFNMMGREGKIELTISGIFSDKTVEYPDSAPEHRYTQENTRNHIITTYNFFTEADRDRLDTVSFLLKHSNDLALFQSELYSKGLPKTYTVQYDTARYKQVEEQITRVSSMSSLWIGIIILVAIGMVFLVNLLSLRERKYEIGVFRAIGMSKSKVALLLMCEMLLLALIGIVIAVIAGSFLAPPLADSLKSAMEWDMPSALKHAIASINGAISVKVTAELIAMTFALVVLACSATLSSIMRFDPVKILSERN